METPVKILSLMELLGKLLVKHKIKTSKSLRAYIALSGKEKTQAGKSWVRAACIFDRIPWETAFEKDLSEVRDDLRGYPSLFREKKCKCKEEMQSPSLGGREPGMIKEQQAGQCGHGTINKGSKAGMGLERSYDIRLMQGLIARLE